MFPVNENRAEGLHTYFGTKNLSPNSYSGKVNLSGSSRNSFYLYGYAPFYRAGVGINCYLIGEKIGVLIPTTK